MTNSLLEKIEIYLAEYYLKPRFAKDAAKELVSLLDIELLKQCEKSLHLAQMALLLSNSTKDILFEPALLSTSESLRAIKLAREGI